MDTEFFRELADQGSLRGFALLDLAPRKLPVSGMLFAERPSGKQNAPESIAQDTSDASWRVDSRGRLTATTCIRLRVDSAQAAVALLVFLA